MPKSKTRPFHKKKVAKRNLVAKSEAEKNKNFQKSFIENLIKQEQEKGLFDNPKAGPLPNGGGISFDGDQLSFDGPKI